MCPYDQSALQMLRIDGIWLSTEALDMRAGIDTLLTKVVLVFGAAQPHHAYLFANARGSRLKIFIQDGYGMWMCTRRLAEGSFSWPRDTSVSQDQVSTTEDS